MADRLHPFDLVLALRLLRDSGTLAQLAEELCVAPSQILQALRRLALSGLIRPGTRAANRHALGEFLEHGVRYAFPARTGAHGLGVPTAHSAPEMSALIDASDAYVWPSRDAEGAIRGTIVTPLYPSAPRLRVTSPETYRLLTLVDALRIGRARERAIATTRLREALGHAAA